MTKAKPSWDHDNQDCECCGAPLKDKRIVWLDLRSSDNTWHKNGVMDWKDPNNQGAFPFGAICAVKALENSISVLLSDTE